MIGADEYFGKQESSTIQILTLKNVCGKLDLLVYLLIIIYMAATGIEVSEVNNQFVPAPATIEAFVRLPRPEQEKIAREAPLSPDMIDQIVREATPDIASTILYRSDVTEHMLLQTAEKTKYTILLRAIASNPASSSRVLEAVMNNPASMIFPEDGLPAVYWVAAHRNATVGQLTVLTSQNYGEQTRGVAISHPKLPEAIILERLQSELSEHVRRQVTFRGSLSPTLLNELAGDLSDWVQEPLWLRITRTKPNEIQQLSNSALQTMWFHFRERDDKVGPLLMEMARRGMTVSDENKRKFGIK